MSDGARPDLTVVVPAFNEERTIVAVLDRLRALGLSMQIVVVDDCSTDGTATLLAEAREGVEVLRHATNQGKGAALRTGFARARGRVVVVQDADLEYDPADIPSLIAPILEGHADVVYGSRLIGGRPQRVHLFWHKAGNRFLSLLTGMLYNTTLTDMETGYKAFTLEVLRSIEPLRESDFRIEPELTAKICRGGFRIYELPISYYGRGYEEGKKITWRDGFPAVWALVKYRFPGLTISRRALNVAVGLAVSVIAAWFALRSVDLDEVGDALRDVRFAWLAAAVVLILIAIAMRGERWRLLFPPEERPRFPATFWALNVGYLLNSVLPFRAGEIGRVLALSHETGLSRTQGLVTVVVERLFDLASVALLMLLVVPAMPSKGLVHVLTGVALGIVAGMAVVVGLLAIRPVRQAIPPLLDRMPVIGGPRASRTRRSFSLGLSALRRPGLAWPVAFWSFASWVVLAISNWFVIKAFPGIDVPWSAAVLVLVATNLAMVVPSSAAALGVFEVAAQAALEAYGVNSSLALSYGLVLHAANVLPVLVLGAVGIARLGLTRRDLVGVGEEGA